MSLTKRAIQLPLTAISVGLEVWEHSRGVREFALRRGTEALQLVAVTPLGRLLPKQLLDDGADEEAARLLNDVRSDTDTTPEPAPAVAAKPAAKAPAVVEHVEPPAAAKEVGAPGVNTQAVEQITDALHVEAPASRDELPIPDFDNISLGSLRARLRSLELADLVTLREWEKAHANRLPVLTTLDNRIAKLGNQSATGDAYPTDASQAEQAAKQAAHEAGATLRV